MSNVAPIRTLDQRRAALQRANKVRVYRAKLKRDIKAERVSVDALLADPPAEIATMKVYELLRAMPKVGRIKADKALRKSRTSPSKTVEGLTPRQRDEILENVTPRFRGRYAEAQERRAA